MSAVVSSPSVILRDLSVKLGVTNSILRKGSEISRLLQLKISTNSRVLQQFNDSCRHILCLDLAASSLGVAFDRETAIALSGMKKRLYLNGYHMFEKMLGLEQKISVKTVCIQLGCSEVIELAESLLNRYVEEHSRGSNRNKPLDLQHPMYAAFAVYCACRHKKVKVSKKVLVEMSRIKGTSFDKVTSEMSSLLAGMETAKAAKKRRATTLMDLVQENLKDSESRKAKGSPSENQEEQDNAINSSDYETWKRRMLEEAGEACS
ncbi:origin recognition complex subunit 6 [Ischnura elegans]|uniref:origin recognition complex subunit 6 n=1 Tax=Ischnura elegans TaxID=197161 RepID=UPI001ED8B38C|nr:origin recognition complex subunit 6 [Ischnura elegans]